jgi:hypothetical protein
MTFPNVVDIIGNVVTASREAGEEAPFYEYGHPLEIVNTLMEKDKSDVWKLKKYPAIFLFHDFQEERTKFNSTCEIKILIVTDTRPDWKAKDRYTNVFNPILLPLAERFLYYMQRSSDFNFKGDHKLKLYPYWGSEATGGNVANDYADAVELSGMKIETFATCGNLARVVTPFNYTLNFKLQ